MKNGSSGFSRRVLDGFNSVSILKLFRAFKTIAFKGGFVHAQDQLQAIRKNTDENSKIINNEAICMLYNGRVEDAKNLMLSCASVPPEAILINVGTISELISSTTEEMKKQMFAKSCEKMSDLFDPQVMKLNL